MHGRRCAILLAGLAQRRSARALSTTQGSKAVLGTLYSLGGVSPRLPPSKKTWIAPGAHVIGDVRLGEDTSVWFNCVLRGDNDPITVGDASNIQEGTVIHTDKGSPCTIGKYCTIGHKVMLHGCTIGDNSLIGMGAIVLDNAVIGKNSLVGAGSLVKGGDTFPDNSLIIGSPAKVIRTFTSDQAAKFVDGAKGYVANSNRFRDELEELPGDAYPT